MLDLLNLFVLHKPWPPVSCTVKVVAFMVE